MNSSIGAQQRRVETISANGGILQICTKLACAEGAKQIVRLYQKLVVDEEADFKR